MTIRNLPKLLIYGLTGLYFVAMLAGFMLILQTEFPQIAFDGTAAKVAEAFRQNRTLVINSHLLLGIGFALFYPLALIVNEYAPAHIRPALKGLLTASFTLRLLPWFGAVPLYMFLGGQSAESLNSAGLGWNGAFILLNTLGEDVAVNLLTGLWALLISVFIWRQTASRVETGLAGVGVVLGVLYILSAGDLVGVDLIQAGTLLGTLVSPLLRVWLVCAILVAVRRPGQKSSC